MENIAGRPFFVDSLGGNTLGRAIKTYLAALGEAGKTLAGPEFTRRRLRASLGRIEDALRAAGESR